MARQPVVQDGFIDDEYLRVCVSIDAENVQEDMRRVAADYAFWNERHADTIGAGMATKAALDQTKAARRMEIRASFDGQGKKVTEATLDAEVEQDAEVIDCRDAFNAADVQRVRTAGILRAINIKADMLVSLGAHQRQEFAAQQNL